MIYKEWINELEIEIDYYSAFIKAWIAFNSWYRKQYKYRQDRKIIEEIKSNNNEFKDNIETLLDLSLSSDNALKFREDLRNLQQALSAATIVTQERDGDRLQISFSDIAISNPKRKSSENYNRTHYELARDHEGIKVLVHKKNDSSIIYFEYNQNNYDLSIIESHPDFQKLSPEQQGQCKAFYKEIKPYNTESVLTSDKNGKTVFIEERARVSRGIVEVLYLLRCSLMHGEVKPSKNASEVYKYAYLVLFAILKNMV